MKRKGRDEMERERRGWRYEAGREEGGKEEKSTETRKGEGKRRFKKVREGKR